MPLQIIRQDITKLHCDAIVAPADETLSGNGGAEAAIHRAAGPGLLEECRTLGGCETGQAKLTGAYDLPCRYVIHTVGPRWHGGSSNEKQQLRACYLNSLDLARSKGCENIAFPLLCAGAFGYPKDQALETAVSVISDYLSKYDMTVYLVVFGKEEYQIGSRLFSDIQSYIDDNYAAAHTDERYASYTDAGQERMRRARRRRSVIADSEDLFLESPLSAGPEAMPPATSEKQRDPFSGRSSLSFLRGRLDESFSQMLLRKIDEKGMTDSQCYKKANIDRKLFSKIRSDVRYRPSKPTAIAFAIALELPLEEAQEMLMKAGYAFSHSNYSDLIVEYFIQNGNYNIFEINEALFAFDQSILGG